MSFLGCLFLLLFFLVSNALAFKQDPFASELQRMVHGRLPTKFLRRSLGES